MVEYYYFWCPFMADEKNTDNDITSIRLRKSTLKMLEELKLVESETIESVILRIIEYAPHVRIVIEPKQNNVVSNPITNKEIVKQDDKD